MREWLILCLFLVHVVIVVVFWGLCANCGYQKCVTGILIYLVVIVDPVPPKPGT